MRKGSAPSPKQEPLFRSAQQMWQRPAGGCSPGNRPADADVSRGLLVGLHVLQLEAVETATTDKQNAALMHQPVEFGERDACLGGRLPEGEQTALVDQFRPAKLHHVPQLEPFT
jgi:hypothetical protein